MERATKGRREFTLISIAIIALYMLPVYAVPKFYTEKPNGFSAILIAGCSLYIYGFPMTRIKTEFI